MKNEEYEIKPDGCDKYYPLTEARLRFLTHGVHSVGEFDDEFIIVQVTKDGREKTHRARKIKNP